MSDLFSPVSVLSKLSLQKAQRNLDDSKTYLFNDFRSIAKILSQYNPLEVMKMSLWEERRIDAVSTKDEVKRRAAVLLPIILQSIVESDFMEGRGTSLEVKSKDWERLKSLSEDIVRRLARIIDSLSAIAICNGDSDVVEAEKLRSSIEKRLLPGSVDKESQEREIWRLRSQFEEIPDFQSRMGSDYIAFILNVQNISRYSLNCIDDLVRDVALYKEEYSLSEAQMRSSGELDGLTEKQIFDKITKKNHWEGRAQSLTDRRDGYSLFMPETYSSLPEEAYAQYSVKAFSLNIDAFISRGFWPAARYPFFEMDGKIYTFVGKHLPFFLSLSCLIDRFLASSRDVLSIFNLMDCDTYSYDGNKIEISVLPSVLDINPVLYPSSLRNILRRRKAEDSVQRKLGHKKLVVDPDMEEDMEKKDDVLYVSSAFLSRATVDKNAKRNLLSSLLGVLELPEEEESIYTETDDYFEGSEPPLDDVECEKSSYEYEYEYNDEDEDEMSKKLDERYDNLTLVEYDKTTPTEEEKKSLIDRYSLTDEIIKKSEEEENYEERMEKTLDDDIFDDTEEEEHLDDIGVSDSDSEYYEEVEAGDEYIEEEKTPEDGQLDFFSILDDESSEEKEFEDELDEEDEESFEEEEKKEEILDNDIGLPDEEESVEEENIEETENFLMDEVSDPAIEMEKEEAEAPAEDDVIVEEEEESSDAEEALEPVETEAEETEAPVEDDVIVEEEEELSDSEEALEPVETEAEETEAPAEDDFIVEEEEESSDSEEALEPVETEPEETEAPVEDDVVVEEEEESSGAEETLEPVETEAEETEAPVEDDVIVEEEEESSDSEEALEPVETESEPSLDDSGEEDFVLPIATVDEEPLVKETEEETNHNPISSDSKEKEENSFVFDDSEVLPKAESVENKKPPMSFTDNLFAALGMEDDEEDAPVEEVAESTATESPIEEMEEETSGEEIKTEDSSSHEASIEETQEEQEGEECVMEDSPMEELQMEEEPAPPEIPGVIGEIYKTLGSSSSFAEFIKLSDEDTLSDLDDVIESCWNRQQMEGKDKMFNIPDYNLSIILARDSVRDELRLSELLNNAGGVMYSRDAENWNAVIVYIDSSHVVEKALERTITKDSFSPSDWKRVTYIGEQLKKR